MVAYVTRGSKTFVLTPVIGLKIARFNHTHKEIPRAWPIDGVCRHMTPGLGQGWELLATNRLPDLRHVTCDVSALSGKLIGLDYGVTSLA